jgi:hypothetical protein
LRLGIASHPADAFLDFPADDPSSAGYAIFVHDDLPICIRRKPTQRLTGARIFGSSSLK